MNSFKIDHDFHIHTRLSLCAGENGGTYKDYIDQFCEQGLKKVGFTDHYWDEEVGYEACSMGPGIEGFYKIQNTAYVLQLKDEIEKSDSKGIEVFFGAEAEYDPVRRDVALSEKNAEVFDFVIVPNSHTHIVMPKDYYYPYRKHVDFMIQSYIDIVNSPIRRKILSIAHPFDAVACPYEIDALIALVDDDTFKRIFDMTAESGIAFELNTYSMKYIIDGRGDGRFKDEYVRMVELARKYGVKLVCGSDAHSLKGHAPYTELCDYAVELFGLTKNDIASLPL